MKKVKSSFRKNGFDYGVLKRTENTVILSQKMRGIVEGYEVHKIQKMTNPYVLGKRIAPYERLAGNEQFGVYAWAFNTLACAERRFDELVLKEEGH